MDKLAEQATTKSPLQPLLERGIRTVQDVQGIVQDLTATRLNGNGQEPYPPEIISTLNNRLSVAQSINNANSSEPIITQEKDVASIAEQLDIEYEIDHSKQWEKDDSESAKSAVEEAGLTDDILLKTGPYALVHNYITIRDNSNLKGDPVAFENLTYYYLAGISREITRQYVKQSEEYALLDYTQEEIDGKYKELEEAVQELTKIENQAIEKGEGVDAETIRELQQSRLEAVEKHRDTTPDKLTDSETESDRVQELTLLVNAIGTFTFMDELEAAFKQKAEQAAYTEFLTKYESLLRFFHTATQKSPQELVKLHKDFPHLFKKQFGTDLSAILDNEITSLRGLFPEISSQEQDDPRFLLAVMEEHKIGNNREDESSIGKPLIPSPVLLFDTNYDSQFEEDMSLATAEITTGGLNHEEAHTKYYVNNKKHLLDPDGLDESRGMHFPKEISAISIGMPQDGEIAVFILLDSSQLKHVNPESIEEAKKRIQKTFETNLDNQNPFYKSNVSKTIVLVKEKSGELAPYKTVDGTTKVNLVNKNRLYDRPDLRA